MENYLITIHCSDNRKAQVVSHIKTLGEWAELSPGTYLVTTGKAPGVILEAVHPLIDATDSIWVMKASAPWAAYGDPIAEDYCCRVLGKDDPWAY